MTGAHFAPHRRTEEQRIALVEAVLEARRHGMAVPPWVEAQIAADAVATREEMNHLLAARELRHIAADARERSPELAAQAEARAEELEG